ncbi:heterokaryon incompatibility [Clohesyomyces aquaticus]|uniref:Heterokaryon incompatibility n=1 Tax=Clohesyomyces aquaticus TaxID=1231657 RepID=A0A1Y1ZE23_9PLEO|nr:heterokaryon incompatibility [Clohesyomyces aquaticus]
MRLLRIEELGSFGGTYSLDEYIGKNIPPYAVLSHTWGPDSDEVSFKDVRKGKGKSKAGYQKIHFCAKQAAADGLQHFWVDTCCIDKSSSAELTEAINSMFRWYQHSTKCYVYLADVSVKGLGANDLSRAMTWQTWRAAFQRSRWFTRGWTLQELLAPISVVFFSAEGEKLGDKHSLLQEIHDTSHVPPEALQGRPLHKFSTGERMLWAAKRETKREEDAAYSLLGIFDIQIPLIYGEGREKAFMRLQRELERESAFARSQSINGARLHNHFLPPSNDAWAVGTLLHHRHMERG